MNKSEKIWMNGELVNWHDAKIHILSHVIHYGSSTFEGIRCYDTDKGSAILFFDEHIKRLYQSSKIYRMEIPYSEQELKDAIIATIKANGHKACYIRPLVKRGQGALGVNPALASIEVAIATWEWGSYLGEEVLENGVDVCVSSWARLAPNTLPTWAKAGGNYLNSQLIKMEALMDNYAEGIGLDVHGYVAEGSGENIFVIRDGIIYTPMSGQSILPGITRNAVIHIARELGYEVQETLIPREALYIADEVFLTGTAAEITPVRSIDKYAVGDEKRGPITELLQSKYLDIVKKGTDPYNWLTFI
ncbi:MAG: branched-chain amino acid transaminase [Prosthecochloris sp.]|uniref:Branched-chain-amino-acid aminotransferase n=1 Tax=Prosthecochloris aestuarii (strain DSM 271 / SK 413) TaxID=290512 RepID=B4S5K8_PROA2|nr:MULTISPECIES: branched-chain amino acid transaminase [Prosthecochloris]ACF45605.1 branched-chain amino acid aminotransferase [Prosthecochloris aestuarii DSM 271]MCW8799044.1 branched-chain amino acid transaminase [Prosthecochloris sp.]RDD31587.1 branched-chain amino acid transaminase [Prosthecochloris sp. ZM]